MTGSELAAWRKARKVSQKVLAEILGVHILTVTRWETDARAIPSFLPLALRTIEREKLASKKKFK